MTATTKEILKSYFNTGDIPTETQFASLIDTIGASSLTVAASDASDISKGRADYICDGVNDEVQIQAAIDALPALGGRVLLTEGNFYLSTGGMWVAGTAEHNNKYYCMKITKDHGPITIEGIPGATNLKLIDSQTSTTYMILVRGTKVAYRTNATYIKGISFDLNGSNQPAPQAGDYCPAIVVQYSGNTFINNCRFKNMKLLAIHTWYIAPRCIISECYFEGNGGGVRSEGYNTIIANNIFNFSNTANTEECIAVAGAPDADEAYPNPPGGYYDNYGLTITGNVFFGAAYQVALLGSKGCTVSGNIFTDKMGYAISLNGCANNIINANTFYNTQNGIYVNNGSTYNLVSNNIFLTGQVRHNDRGIYEYTSCGGHNYYINNIIEAWDTAILTKAGAGSIARGNIGWKNENCGTAANVSDGGTIDHGLICAPVWANVTPSISGEFVSITSLDTAHITVAIKKHDGTAGTTQTLYWEAKMQDAISA